MCWTLVAIITLAHGQGTIRMVVDPCLKDCPAHAREMQIIQDTVNPLLPDSGLPIPRIVYACELQT